MNINISCFQKQEDEARAPEMLPANTSVCVALHWCLVFASEGGKVENRLIETSSDPLLGVSTAEVRKANG